MYGGTKEEGYFLDGLMARAEVMLALFLNKRYFPKISLHWRR